MRRCRPKAPASTSTWQVLLDGGITEAMIATYHGHNFRPHFHETFAVGVALAGCHRLWCEGRTWQLQAGDVMVIPPRAIHTGVGGKSKRWAIGMVFPPATMATTHPRHQGVVLRAVPGASAIVAALRRSLLGRASAGQQLIDLSLQLMTVAERCAAPVSTTVDYRAREARDALDTCGPGPLSIRELAARIRLHPTYLTKVFRDAYGIGPYAYWLASRVETARHWLRGGSCPSQLAHRLGFADQSHFTRTFRRTVGVAPGRYRDSLLHSRDLDQLDAILKLF